MFSSLTVQPLVEANMRPESGGTKVFSQVNCLAVSLSMLVNTHLFFFMALKGAEGSAWNIIIYTSQQTLIDQGYNL